MKKLKQILQSRYSLFFALASWFLLSSSLFRIVLLIWQAQDVDLHITAIIRTLFTGCIFDIGTLSLLSVPALIYFTFLPSSLVGSKIDRILIYIFSTLFIFLMVLVFFAEATFWEEFRCRFNFIAVDYLIYTYEVVANIQQSYPLPLLMGGVALLTFLLIYFFLKVKSYHHTFSQKESKKNRFGILAVVIMIQSLFLGYVNNNDAEWSSNRYNSEISKAGIYSFFAAMRSNQMNFSDFYTTIPQSEAFAVIRKTLAQNNSKFTLKTNSIHRKITRTGAEKTPNVIMILSESLSASFMKTFGNKEGITPTLDSLAQCSLFFSNMNATGTRTVRGMEAVTLCIPPTPGQSIVKRPKNQNLFTISNVFNSKGYECNFFYGGDGYFDNMNAYFGGNGFTIFDRGRGSVLSDQINTTRYNINDQDVSFENAWGVCDEDVFRKMIKIGDQSHSNQKPFFNFVMTTSNHKPYTYPSGRIDIPSGTGRSGAVKYADYAIKMLLKEASKKPWFKNTVFVIVADHCASSAGKNEIDVKNYHIPAFIINGPKWGRVNKQCSQIDLFPTLFSLFNWSHDSDFFGSDVLHPAFQERAFLGTYRKLAFMKKNKVLILSDQKKQTFYTYDASGNLLHPKKMEPEFLKEAISWYQTADFLYSHDRLH